MKSLLFQFILLVPATLYSQQNIQSYRILDSESQQPIPYAHISNNEKLITLSDYSGFFSLDQRNNHKSFIISYVGYQNLIVEKQPTDNKVATIIIYLKPDSQKLNEVVITPTTIKDLIAEIYKEIPNKYYSNPHVLVGNYYEYYKDTLNGINAYMDSEIEIMKNSYRDKNKKGTVKTVTYRRLVSDSSKFQHMISAGPHIPHRFDFVMKREEFINPSKFDQYTYTFLKEINYKNHVLDVIKFEPKRTFFGSSFYGKIFIDTKEKVFIKAEYNYTNYGFLVNRHSNWAKHRKFITEYKEQNGMWHLYYTWDEAVSRTQNFKLTQEFHAKRVINDTVQNLEYIEKFNYNDVFLLKEDSSLDISENEISKEEILNSYAENNKLYKVLSKFEFPIGIKLLQLPNQNIVVNSTFDFENTSTSISSNFETFSLEPALSVAYTYRMKKNWLVDLTFSQNFRKSWKIESFALGLNKKIALNTNRPLYFNFGLAYLNTKNTFQFSKLGGFTPKYEKNYIGLNGSIKFEIELNPRKRFYVGYNYAHQLSEKDQFFLERKHGFLNLKKEKRDYDLQNVNLQVNEAPASTLSNVFINCSLDLGLLISLGW